MGKVTRQLKAAAYRRDDGAEMVELQSGGFVARDAAEKLGLALPAAKRGAGPAANKAMRAAPLNKRAKAPA